MAGTDRYEGQVCPNDDCHIDQRFHGFRGFCCPECACRLVVACSKCDSGAVERVDGSPFCADCAPELVADGGTGVPEASMTVYRVSSTFGSSKPIHTDPECRALQRASQRVHELDPERVPECRDWCGICSGGER